MRCAEQYRVMIGSVHKRGFRIFPGNGAERGVQQHEIHARKRTFHDTQRQKVIIEPDRTHELQLAGQTPDDGNDHDYDIDRVQHGSKAEFILYLVRLMVYH